MENKVVKLARDKTARDYLAGIKVVDTDTHITEWPDLWTSRATPKFKDRVPQVKTVDGKRAWMIDNHQIAGDSGFAAVKKDGSKLLGLDFFNMTFNDVHPGAHDVRARLAYMDQAGIAAQIAYTNLLGFGGQRAMKVDAELRLVSTQILNDALAEFQANSNKRIYPMAMTPWWDVKLAVAEIERCANMGMRGINMTPTPEFHKLPDLGDPYWTPLWELCEDRKLPVNFHIGTAEGIDWFGSGWWPTHSKEKRYVVGTIMNYIPNMQIMLNLLISDIFKRHPKLKFVSVESGVGWVLFMLEKFDYQMTDSAGIRMEESIVDVFRRHFYACGWFEKDGILDFVRRVGPDNVLFETDFPHPTCLYPNPFEQVAPMLPKLTDDERRKVFGGTAERLYNLDLSAV
jgi:predicted TIM-barrel fold metal-dependent hydrolase